ncbi:hypothetical protein RCL1_008786 [Eukaryota sp. TZLM3-RCL]
MLGPHTCLICWGDLYQPGEERAVPDGNCGHVFHLKCLQEARKSNNHCPLCRKAFHNCVKLFLDDPTSDIALEAAQTEILSLKDKISRISHDLPRLQTVNKSLKEENEKLVFALDKARTEFVKNQERITELENKFFVDYIKKKNLTASKFSSILLKQSKEALYAIIIKQQDRIKRCDLSINSLQTQLENYKTENFDLKKDVENLKKELTEGSKSQEKSVENSIIPQVELYNHICSFNPTPPVEKKPNYIIKKHAKKKSVVVPSIRDFSFKRCPEIICID